MAKRWTRANGNEICLRADEACRSDKLKMGETPTSGHKF